jgi:hypothetical protein
MRTLPDADDTALAALGKVRGNGVNDGDAELAAAMREIDELKEAVVGLTLRLHRPVS